MKNLHLLKSNRGSSSVLVIFVMVALVIFGVLSLMSSYANLKLSRKNLEWSGKYYALDSRGQACVEKVDGCLLAAEKEAKAYMEEIETGAVQPSAGDIPEDIAARIKEQALLYAGQGEGRFVRNTWKKLYYYLAAAKIKNLTLGEGIRLELSPDYVRDGRLFDGNVEIPSAKGLAVSLKTEGKKNGHEPWLEMGLQVLCPDYGSKPGEAPRLEIRKWKVRQDEFEYQDGLK